MMILNSKAHIRYLAELKQENMSFDEVEERRKTDPMVQGFVNIVGRLIERIEHVENRLDRLERHVYGRKAEKTSVIKSTLDLGDADYVVNNHKASRKKPARQDLPDHLPRTEIILDDLTDEDKICGCCGYPKVLIGSEVREELVITRPEARVNKFIRNKYAYNHCKQGKMVMANDLPRLINKSIASHETYAFFMHQKFVMHMPVERLEREFKRQGLPLSRSTVYGWFGQIYDLFIISIIKAMKVELMESKVINADETTLKKQKSDEKGKCHTGYLWVFVGGKAVLYHYNDGRKQSVPLDFLEGFKGILLTDGLASYNEVVRKNNLKHANCNAHDRRNYVDLLLDGDQRAKGVIEWYSKIYELEKRAKENNYSKEQLLALRQSEGIALWEDRKILQEQLEQNNQRPKDPLGKALKYTKVRWDSLKHYLDDPAIPIDNNIAERAVKDIVIGRKAWMFCKTEESAQMNAAYFSIAQTCKLLGVDCYHYLIDLFNQLAQNPKLNVKEHTPAKWAEKIELNKTKS